MDFTDNGRVSFIKEFYYRQELKKKEVSRSYIA